MRWSVMSYGDDSCGATTSKLYSYMFLLEGKCCAIDASDTTTNRHEYIRLESIKRENPISVCQIIDH